MNWRVALIRCFGVAALLTLPCRAAVAQEAYGPKDEQAEAGWDGEFSASGTYAKRSRDLISDFDRSGFGVDAVVGYTLPAGKTTTVRLEANAGADKYTTSYGARAELTQELGAAVTARVTASGTRHAVVLESLDAEQASVQGALAIKAGAERVEFYARNRWRRYNDAQAGTGPNTGSGWQVGARWRHRFGAYHWFNAHAALDRINGDFAGAVGDRHSYRRTSVSLDYSHPVAKRLRVLVGADYRAWTYGGRTVGDVVAAPLRHDRLIRPELGLSWGKTKGAYIRATAGYDFYRSNDVRYTGDGPRARVVVGFRF